VARKIKSTEPVHPTSTQDAAVDPAQRAAAASAYDVRTTSRNALRRRAVFICEVASMLPPEAKRGLLEKVDCGPNCASHSTIKDCLRAAIASAVSVSGSVGLSGITAYTNALKILEKL
jgi:hypothetical protein